jgi:geranylgeranyl diphosphate synthase, type II
MEFLQKHLALVNEAIIAHQFKQQPTELYAPLNYILEDGGKRIRPIMALMASELFGGDVQKTLKPALGLEFFHNFSLIHDDIMDNAPLRRNRPTIHASYGLNVGILAGDALFIKAYQFFEDLEPVLFKACIKVFSETGAILCDGQQMDVNFETCNQVTYEQYIQMISSKTGVLAGASLKIGALIAGASAEEAEALYQFGNAIGICFQMTDDYLDVFGDVTKFGKQRAGDIYENKKTILYLMAVEHASAEDRAELAYWYAKKTDNPDKIYGVENIFKRSKVEEHVLKHIQTYHDKAYEYLYQINQPKEKLAVFEQLAQYLLKRDN